MRILLTGATGFIGSHLVHLLGYHQLLLIGRKEIPYRLPNLSYVQGDLADIERWEVEVRNFSPEACIHLAWEGLPDYSLTNCLKNFEAGISLFELLGSLGCKKILAAGTCWEYGDLRGQAGEKDIPREMNLFASFKTALRVVGESLSASYGVDFIWGRIFFIYGIGQREDSLIPYCSKVLKDGKSPQIKKPNDVNDFIHVSDVTSAILALIETPNIYGVFNIGTGVPLKVGEVVVTVARRLGLQELYTNDVDSSEEKGNWADISRMHRKVGWQPKHNIESGIRATINNSTTGD